MWVALSCTNKNMTSDRRREERRESTIVQQNEMRPAIESVTRSQRREKSWEGGEGEKNV